ASVACRAHHHHPKVSQDLRRRGNIVLDLTVVRTKGHVDDVDGIAEVPVAVWIEGRVQALKNGDAAAEGGVGAANCEGRENGAGSPAKVGTVAALAADNVGDMGSMTIEVDRI